MKKVFSLIFAAVLTLSCMLPAFAANNVTVDYINNVATTKFPSMSLEAGSKLHLPEDTKVEGYDFAGWYLDQEYTNPVPEDYKAPESDFHIYGKWNAKSYTITFDTNGRKTIAAQTYKYKDKLELPDATVSGFNFDGWYADREFKNKFTLETMPADNIVLYAKYIEVTTKALTEKPTETTTEATTEKPTEKQDESTTSPTEPSGDVAETSTTNVIIIKEKKDENPETGSSVLGVTAFAALAVAGIAFVAAKKKED